MIAAVYGLQALVFVLRAKWDMIGWMVFYILAIPLFSLVLPLYSFWKMDDFSWGSTRVVLGESGKKIVVHVRSLVFSREHRLISWQDEGKFDPRSIPLKSWNDYVSLTSLDTQCRVLNIATSRKTNSGTRSRTTALDRGSLLPRCSTMDMRRATLRLSTAERHSMNLPCLERTRLLHRRRT